MPDALHATPMADRTVAAVMDRAVATCPDKVAVRDDRGASITYAELRDHGLRVAGCLAGLGVERQGFAVVMLDNHLDHVTTWVGLSLAALIEVPVNTAFKGELLVRVCAQSTARVAVIEGHYCSRFERIIDRLPDLETVVVRGRPDADLSKWVKIVDFDVLGMAEPIVAEPPRVSDIAALLFTSGTEGVSKGALMPHGEIFQISVSFSWVTQPDDVVLVALPLFHAAGLFAGIYNALRGRATAVLLPVFSASGFWDVVRRHGCTQMLMVGAMAEFLWRQPPRSDDADHTLRDVCVLPAPSYVLELGKRFGMSVSTSYGSTETGAVAIAELEDMAPRVCGRARSFVDLRIVDDDDVEVPSGEVGEIVVRPLQPWTLMQGYHGLPEATVTAWRNLWFHTGDSGYMDESGLLFFVDRKKDTLRRRGENVSSLEVEKAIIACGGIAETAVIAVTSEFTEDEMMVFLVLTPGAAFDPVHLLRELCDSLPYFMVPRYFEVVAELPRTATFKIRKDELRASGVTAATWDCVSAGYRVTRSGLEELRPVP